MQKMAENIAAALAELQTKLPRVKKAETARVKSDKGSYSYNYATLADISAQVLPLLGELGLSFTTRPTLNEGGAFVLAYELLHTSGDSRCGEYPLPTAGTPQAIGSAITYGRRYCLCAVTGVAPDDDDDDGAAAETAVRRQLAPSRNKDGSLPRRGVSDEDLEKSGRMTRQQAKDHNELADTSSPRKAERHSGLVEDDPWETGDLATKPQLGKVGALFGQVGWNDPEDRLRASSSIVGRPLKSAFEMSKAEASTLIDALALAADDPDPSEKLTEMVAAVREQEGGQS